MLHSIASLTSPDVAAVVRRSRMAVLPLGSIEQHGPHLPCGTDTMAAEAVAERLAGHLDALYVPFAPYGVTPIHAGHPGTISLSRETFESLLRDICSELHAMGVDTFVLVNWHEGNTPSLDAVATEVQDRTGATFVVAQACYVAQRIYRNEGGELTHGGGIETLAVMACDPGLLRLDRVAEPARPPGAEALDAMRRSREVYGFVTDVTELAEEGWYGRPDWATADRAATFAERVAGEVLEQLKRVVAARRRGTGDGSPRTGKDEEER
ncbi:MAG: creatininase family protein [Nitriliruptorales bacterium]|nr:creatininase family protein [Nitriliruptorales bacterium]